MSVDGQHFACANVKRLLQLPELFELIKRVEIIKQIKQTTTTKKEVAIVRIILEIEILTPGIVEFLTCNYLKNVMIVLL